MASWANALQKTVLDLSNGGPVVFYEIKSHAINASQEVVVENNLDLRGMTKNSHVELSWALEVTAGTGTPKVVVKWMNANNEILGETILSTTPFRIVSQKAMIVIRETGGNAATYGAVLKLK